MEAPRPIQTEPVGAGEATIVSLVPFPLREFKPGLIPEYFEIPAAPDGSFCLYPIKVAIGRIYIDENRGFMQYPILASQLAQSLCRDYIISNLYIEEGVAEPGLFWVPGHYEQHQTAAVSSVHTKELEHHRKLQRNWFKRQVQAADEAWGKYPGKHGIITGTQRFACQQLGLERDWLIETQMQRAESKCPLCMSLVEPDAILCYNCKYVLDEKRYEQLSARVAKDFPVPAKTEK